MRRRIVTLPLAAAAAATCLTAPPAPATGECDVIVPTADRLETEFSVVSPNGTPPYVAGRIRSALSPLYGLQSPAAVDLRLRSDMVASQVDNSDRYRPASPELLVADLAEARQLLAAARQYCSVTSP